MIETSNTTVNVPAISVRVLFFSVLREQVGRSSLEVSIPTGSHARHLVDHLSTMYPAIEAYRSIIRVAINQEYVDNTVEINHNDEVALITPVSGG